MLGPPGAGRVSPVKLAAAVSKPDKVIFMEKLRGKHKKRLTERKVRRKEREEVEERKRKEEQKLQEEELRRKHEEKQKRKIRKKMEADEYRKQEALDCPAKQACKRIREAAENRLK
jgi:polynucleotide 5'-kinase involved in rRNA processing